MKIPPHFPHPTALRHLRSVKRAMKDFPGGVGYGTITILFEILSCQQNLEYPLEDIDILSDEIGISIPIIRTIIEKYGIFSLIIDKKGESFFSIKLNAWMEPYYKKIEENKLKGMKSGLVRRKKIEREIKELELSQGSSSKPQFNHGSATVEQIEEKRREKKRKEEEKENISCTEEFKKKFIRDFKDQEFHIKNAKFGEDMIFKIKEGRMFSCDTQKLLSKDDDTYAWNHIFQNRKFLEGGVNEK